VTGQLLTAEDVATMLGMGTDWIYTQVRANQIPHVRLGRYVRFRAESIDRWISELEREATINVGKSAGARLAPSPAWHRRESSHAEQT
jgi:excisionase family DNA binding protein